MLMATHEARLDALRRELTKQNLTGFVIPISDPHMSEYVGEYAERLKYLSGFGGSAGTIVVLPERAAIFVDGRYTVQVREQVDPRLFEPVAIAETGVADWIAANAPDGARIGYDPWLHSSSWVERTDAAAQRAGAILIAVDANPVDTVWQDRPGLPGAYVDVHGPEFSGRSAADKLADIGRWLVDNSLDATVMTALDSVAWTFNIRGRDIAHTPVALAYALVRADGGATLFVDPAKLTDDVRAHLGNNVELAPYDGFSDALGTLAGQTVAVDQERVPVAVLALIEGAGATLAIHRDPAVLMKAIKNDTEIAGTRSAHIRDGVALTRFLCWFSATAPAGGLDELSAAAKLRDYRDETGCLEDLSFRTISATGPHGALPHYSVDADSNIMIEPGQLYLVDSGGQYRDGTTDVTRVVAVGEPTAEMCRRYTQVLKGHIALARAIFPKGTRGGQLDTLARQYLWAGGVDFLHGTGHGVGSYLSVHEGPQRIASSAAQDEPLQAGMILSNEPGYYKEGAFGIRIENLVLVSPVAIDGAEAQMLGFETLTFAPLDRALIDVARLDPTERGWVDDYHAAVRAKIGPQLSDNERAWLDQAAAAL